MKNLLENYQTPFDLDGQLRPVAGVTEAKVFEAKKLIEAARRSRVEEARLSELFTTSDLSYSIAHLLNLQFVPQLPEELEDMDTIADYRVVKDFSPVALRGQITGGVEGAGVDARGAAAIVPEGTPYPEVKVSGSAESFYSRLAKRGFRATVTFESIIGDILGELERLPEEFLRTTADTVKAEVWDALDMASQHVAATTLPDGTTVAADPTLSPLGVIAAATDIETREVNGRKIGRISAYNLFVPVGQQRFFEYELARWGRVISIQDGSLTLGPDSEIQALFPNVTVRETDRLTGTEWKLVPKPGTTKGRPVLSRLGLRGYESPELRVQNDGGGYIAGGEARAGMWRIGFDTDTAALRYRFITGAALFDDTFVGVSDGTGAITAP